MVFQEMNCVMVLTNDEMSGCPDMVKILPVGKVNSEKGDFIVDMESFQAMKAEMQRRGIDIVIDYEHQTLKDVQAPAGGWVKDLVYTPEAIVAKVEWTPKAREYLNNKEYRYLSPVVLTRKSDSKAVVLHSLALTNIPAINRMFAIVNSVDFDTDNLLNTADTGGKKMDLQQIFDNTDFVHASGTKEEWIVLTAHYDTTSLSHGAYDNMSGCAGLLGIMEYMKDKERNYGLRDVKKQLDEYLFRKRKEA